MKIVFKGEPIYSQASGPFMTGSRGKTLGGKWGEIARNDCLFCWDKSRLNSELVSKDWAWITNNLEPT